jgi:type II secretory pathway component PulF
MTTSQPNNRVRFSNLRTLMQDDLPQPLALLIFTQRLSALKEANVGIPRALDILQEAPAPYGAASGQIKTEIDQGNTLCQAMSEQDREDNKDTWWYPRSLFRAMSKHLELFPPIYVTLVRAGEMAGAVDETLRRLHSALAREWRLLASHPEDERHTFLTRTASFEPLHDWQDLSVYQQMATLTLFFETFGMLLISGVALLPAMDAVSALLPARQSGEFLQIRREIAEGAPLLALPVERLAFIPRYAKEIAGLGQMRGCLDSALHEAAELFERELDYRLLGGR